MKYDYHNVIITLEVIVKTNVGEMPTDEMVRGQIKSAIKNGEWVHYGSSKVVNTVTE